MEQISATRSQLLAQRAQIELAALGCELLEDKRRALLVALREVAQGALAAREALERAAVAGRDALHEAEAVDGPAAVRSASWAADGELFLDADVTMIVGVEVPLVTRRDVGRSVVERGYALVTTSPQVDRVAERFEDELDLIVELASKELRQQRLAEAIARTGRRANALRHVLLPRLRAQRARIELVLDEREREDRFRLRRARRRRS